MFSMQQCPPNWVLANLAKFFRTILCRNKHVLLYFRMSLINHLSRRLYHPFKLMMLCSLDLHFPYQVFSFLEVSGVQKAFLDEKKIENIYFCFMKHVLRKYRNSLIRGLFVSL